MPPGYVHSRLRGDLIIGLASADVGGCPHRDRYVTGFLPHQVRSPRTGEGRAHPAVAEYSRTTLAGTPATTHRSGTWPRTTEPAATTTFRPMHAPGSTTAPAPSQLPGPIETAVLLGHCLPIGMSGSE